MKKFSFSFILFISHLICFSQNHTVKKSNFFDKLTKEEIRIIVNKGTERKWSGKYNNHSEVGIYVCKACNNPLFRSSHKFNAECGWPSFDDEINGSMVRVSDFSYNMKRVEIICSNCKGHLGHVFEGEGYTEKNLRHCVNSISLNFIDINTFLKIDSKP